MGPNLFQNNQYSFCISLITGNLVTSSCSKSITKNNTYQASLLALLTSVSATRKNSSRYWMTFQEAQSTPPIFFASKWKAFFLSCKASAPYHCFTTTYLRLTNASETFPDFQHISLFSRLGFQLRYAECFLACLDRNIKSLKSCHVKLFKAMGLAAKETFPCSYSFCLYSQTCCLLCGQDGNKYMSWSSSCWPDPEWALT